MRKVNIPFNQPYVTGKEIDYVKEACELGVLSGDGKFTKYASELLTNGLRCKKILLTPSCTAALEMMAILLDIKEGDEVIMPSYTFVSTANAFALRGAKIVFCDIDSDTLNIDPISLEKLISKNTKAIIPVHYAGNSCDMNAINKFKSKDISILEDAAQALFSSYNNTPLGTIGRLGAFSFHETKNIHCGEGGALVINDDDLIDRAEYIRDKGTNRSSFFRGEIDKYTWVDIGSSYLLGELSAAFLSAQIEDGMKITNERIKIWSYYNQSLAPLEASGKLRLPKLTTGATQNAHMFYLILNCAEDRNKFIEYSREQGVQSIFHYVPLHSAPAAKYFSDSSSELFNTESLSSRLVRLPLWIGVDKERVVNLVYSYFRS